MSDYSDDEVVMSLGPCIVQQHRAFGSPTVTFGPFATIAEATAWCIERGFGHIVLLTDPSLDTSAGAEVWR